MLRHIFINRVLRAIKYNYMHNNIAGFALAVLAHGLLKVSNATMHHFSLFSHFKVNRIIKLISFAPFLVKVHKFTAVYCRSIAQCMRAK